MLTAALAVWVGGYPILAARGALCPQLHVPIYIGGAIILVVLDVLHG